MKRLVIALSVAALLAVPTAASARSVLWAGTHGTPGVFDFAGVPFETLMLDTNTGRVSIKSLQAVMTCTNPAGHVSPVAFWVTNSHVRATLHSNRYTIDLSSVANGGRHAAVHVTGTLGSNGRGSARIRILGNSRDSNGAILERCSREVTIAVRRGPS